MGSLWSREVPRSQTVPLHRDHPFQFYVFRDPYLDESGDLCHQYKLTVLGDNNSGKTSLVDKFAAATFVDRYTPTIGVDFNIRTVHLDGIKIKLQIWSIGANFYKLTRGYYKSSVCAIITYSVTDEESFNNVPFWIKEIEKFAHTDIRLALVGTKCDCTDDTVVDYTRARDFANERQIPFFEVSNKDGTNVELAFMTLVAEARQLEIDCMESLAKK